MLGDLNGPVAAVDAAGTVAPLGVGWQVAWAIGAADRWRIAANETAVRQCLVDDMPVFATAMRVPGGDVVCTTAAVCDGSGRAAVMEFSNESPSPVSLAVAVTARPGGRPTRRHFAAAFRRAEPTSGIAKAEVCGSAILADGRLAVELGRPPGGAVAVADGDPWTPVRAEPSAGDRAARSHTGQAAAAAVIPLASGVPRRVVVPIAGAPVEALSPTDAAAGWQAVVARAARVELEDPAATRAWRRSVAAAILTAGCRDPAGAALSAVALDQVGLPDEADRARAVVLTAADRSRPTESEAALALRALASRRLRGGRVSGLDEWAGRLAAAAGSRLDAVTLEQVAAALASEAPAAAEDCRRLMSDLHDAPAAGAGRLMSDAPAAGAAAGRLMSDLSDAPAAGAGRLMSDAPADAGAGLAVSNGLAGGDAPADGAGLVAGAGMADAAPAGRSVWDASAKIESVLSCLVSESPGGLVAAPALPERWLGLLLDVRGLCTRHGRLSYSLRWHGSRPALLWQLSPLDNTSEVGVTSEAGIVRPQTVMRCGLDPAWSSSEPEGEVLLLASA